MVLFKFARFCLLDSFNDMDIIRTLTKINSFHSETSMPSTHYADAKSFFVSVEMPAEVMCFDILVVNFVIFLSDIYLTQLLTTWPI